MFSTEPVTDALNSFDNRGNVGEFFSQRTDHDVDHVASSVVAALPHILQQNNTGDGFPRVPLKILLPQTQMEKFDTQLIADILSRAAIR